VVVKTATGAEAPRLRAAGERLLAAAHPGVVEVLSSSGSGDWWELRLVHAGRPLDTIGPLPPEQVAAVAAGAAATLADLHACGIVHGRIDPSHVLLGSHGRPVLCGFGDGAPAGATPADDVATLGALIVALLGTDADLEPIPEHRWRWRRRRVGATWVRRTLLLLADQAAAEPPSRRPSAGRLAAAISEAHPDAVSSSVSGARHDVPAVDPQPASVEPADPLETLRGTAVTAPPPPRLPALACALAGVIVLGAGGVRLARSDGPSPGAESAAVVPTTLPTSLPPATFAPDLDLPPTTATVASPPAPCVPASDVSGTAGCAPVDIDGTVVVVGERRYEVGEPGDLVVAGDWDCDGAPTPALLRPSTGEVFAFPTWAVAGEVVVHAIDQVDGAARIVTEAGDDGCTTLLVERVDGSRTRVVTGDA
jgi:hypothetical protein